MRAVVFLITLVISFFCLNVTDGSAIVAWPANSPRYARGDMLSKVGRVAPQSTPLLPSVPTLSIIVLTPTSTSTPTNMLPTSTPTPTPEIVEPIATPTNTTAPTLPPEYTVQLRPFPTYTLSPNQSPTKTQTPTATTEPAPSASATATATNSATPTVFCPPHITDTPTATILPVSPTPLSTIPTLPTYPTVPTLPAEEIVSPTVVITGTVHLSPTSTKVHGRPTRVTATMVPGQRATRITETQVPASVTVATVAPITLTPDALNIGNESPRATPTLTTISSTLTPSPTNSGLCNDNSTAAQQDQGGPVAPCVEHSSIQIYLPQIMR